MPSEYVPSTHLNTNASLESGSNGYFIGGTEWFKTICTYLKNDGEVNTKKNDVIRRSMRVKRASASGLCCSFLDISLPSFSSLITSIFF